MWTRDVKIQDTSIAISTAWSSRVQQELDLRGVKLWEQKAAVTWRTCSALQKGTDTSGLTQVTLSESATKLSTEDTELTDSFFIGGPFFDSSGWNKLPVHSVSETNTKKFQLWTDMFITEALLQLVCVFLGLDRIAPTRNLHGLWFICGFACSPSPFRRVLHSKIGNCSCFQNDCCPLLQWTLFHVQ